MQGGCECVCVCREGVMQGGPPTPALSLQPLPQDRLWGRRSENWSPGDCSIHRLPPGAQGQRKQWEGRQLQARGCCEHRGRGCGCQPGERRWGLGRAHPHPLSVLLGPNCLSITVSASQSLSSSWPAAVTTGALTQRALQGPISS